MSRSRPRRSSENDIDQAHVSRRGFLRTSVIGGAMALTAPGYLRAASPNEKLNVAVIGCGGRGAGNLDAVAGKVTDKTSKKVSFAGENIVAICDVNEDNLAKASKDYPQAKTFTDFRRLLDNSKQFDAVVVSTCEHTHAFATLPALQLGKHVYCEKPLAHSVWETREIRKAAARAKVATQMGTQIHAGENFRRVVELIQSNAIGPVRDVHVWVARAWGWHPTPEEAKKQQDIVTLQNRPVESEPIPASLNWGLWLGPAPERKFNNIYIPGPKWYRWWDFGGGTMSDLGSHWIDLPFWALKLDHPLTIEASGPPPHPDLAPASMQVDYDYGPRGDLPALKLHWYQGTCKPALLSDRKIPLWDSGILFVGDQGMLLADYGKYLLLPQDKFKDFKHLEPTIPTSIGHHLEWVQACKTGAPTTCNFEYSGRLTEANHLGNVAFRVGKKLEWDSSKLIAANAPESQPFIRREYRKGWSLG